MYKVVAVTWQERGVQRRGGYIVGTWCTKLWRLHGRNVVYNDAVAVAS